jgi:HAD superfamily hydrolase (TIGR01509 family)
MDGLMLDSESMYKPAWQRAARQLGYDLDDEFYFGLIGMSRAGSEDALLARFGPGFPLERFIERWNGCWRADVAAAWVPAKPGLTELLALLERRRIPTAVATSTECENAEFTLRVSGLAGRFAAVATGDQVSRGKPAPDIYLEAARRLNLPPESCLALEDSGHGIRSARGAGMRTILVPDLKPPTDDVTAAASWVFASLYEAREVIERLIEEQRGSGEEVSF